MKHGNVERRSPPSQARRMADPLVYIDLPSIATDAQQKKSSGAGGGNTGG